MERTIPPVSKVTFPEAQLERYNWKHIGWTSAQRWPRQVPGTLSTQWEVNGYPEMMLGRVVYTADSSVATQNVLWGNLAKQRLGLLHQCKTAAALSTASSAHGWVIKAWLTEALWPSEMTHRTEHPVSWSWHSLTETWYTIYGDACLPKHITQYLMTGSDRGPSRNRINSNPRDKMVSIPRLYGQLRE